MAATTLRTRLWEWRTHTGLTLQETSDLTGLSPGYLSRIERGLKTPHPLTKVAIARRLGVAISEIFEVESLDVDGEAEC